MKFLSVLFLIFNLQSAYSAEEIDASESTTPVAMIKPFNRNYGLSSSENRENLTFQFAGAFLGREYLKLNSVTASLAYYTSPDEMLSLRYTNYKSTDPGEVIRLDVLTLGYRMFFGNSFNIMPSLYYKSSALSNGSRSKFNSSGNLVLQSNVNATYKDLGIGFRLGNEWQWKHFVMGCDWFGMNRTVKRFTPQVENNYILSTEELEKDYTYTLLSFYVGYAF